MGRDLVIDDVAGALVKIETALQQLDRQVLLRSLQPGLSDGEVRVAFGSIDLAVIPEVEALYGWHNGTSTAGVAAIDDIHLFPGFYLLSIEDAIANYRAFVTDSRWTIGWLPVFANGGGDFYVLDLSSLGQSPMRHFRIEEAEHPIEFSSLGTMLATFAKAFERGVFFVDPDGYLEMDDLVFGSVAAETDPAVEWWAE